MNIKYNYWFGKSVLTKRIFSKTGTFKALVQHIQRYADKTCMPYTISDYHAFDKSTRDTLKDGLYLLPCSFEYPQRADINTDKINLVCLDIDDSAKGGGDLSELAISMMQYNYAILTTSSHQPGKPRYRIIVEADASIDSTNYKQAVYSLGICAGLYKVSSESAIPSQAMYFPKRLKDQKEILTAKSEVMKEQEKINKLKPKADGMNSLGGFVDNANKNIEELFGTNIFNNKKNKGGLI